MRRRIALLVALVVALLAATALPALAQEEAAERSRRTWPPEWTQQSVGEVRDRVAARAERIEAWIETTRRLSAEEKRIALVRLEEALDAIAAVDERAEIVGTAASRRQLARIEFRAARGGDVVDYEAHISGDVERFSIRLEHLTKIAGWAEAAGEDVVAVIAYLDEAGVRLELATGDGDATERHDAAHVARAWMTEAAVALMAL